MMIVLDTEGRIKLINKKGCEILECSEGQARGKDWFAEFLPEPIRKQTRKAFCDLITGQGEQVEYYENTMRTLSGSEKLIAWHNTVIRDEEGVIIGTLSSGQDITEQKAAEEALQMTQFAVDHAGEAVFLINKQARFEYVNQGACRMLGYTQNELLTMGIEEIDPDFDPQVWPSIWESTNIKRVGRMERRHRRKDGSIFPVEITANDMLYEGRQLHCVFVRDISERKATEKVLQFTQFAVDHAGEAAYWMDSKGRLTYVNDAACQTTGYSCDELLSMSIPDLDPNFPVDKWDEHWAESRRKGSYRIETQHRAKDGRLIPVEVSVNFVDYEGEEYHCSFARDITERKRAEEALRAAEQRKDLALQGGDLGTWDWNVVTGEVIFNERWASMLGYTLDEIEANVSMWQRLLHPDDTQFVIEMVETHLEGKTEFYETEHRLRHKSGRWVWVLDKGQVIERDADGNPIRACGTHLDITDRKLAEEALQESENKHRLLFTGANDGIFIMDQETFIECNPKAVEMYGCQTREQLLNRSPLEFSPEYQEDGRRSAEKAPEYLEGAYNGQPQRFSWVHHKLNGELFYVEVSLVRLELEGQAFLQAIVRDVTERRAAERARERLLRELQSKNEELEGIVFIASHDLRSPLVNIRGFTGELEKSLNRLERCLGEEPLSESARNELKILFGEDIPESLSFIKSGNRKMDVLLNGLLRLSRVGSAEIRPERLDMNPFLEGIANSFLFRTRQEDIEITIDDHLPYCMADAVLLNQVFTNLIDNAIKYRSPDRAARIHISGEINDETAIYCVRDNGIGIASEHIEKVFEIFHRLNPESHETGEGLGLTIVRRVLKRQDGHIRVESQPDVGTSVYVELPKA